MSIPTGFQDDRVAANDGLEQLVDRSWSVDDFDLVRFITIFQTENEVAIVGVLVIPLHAGFELDALGGPGARTGSWMCSTHRFQLTIWCFWPSPASFYNWEDDAENSPSIVMHRARASSKKRASALHTHRRSSRERRIELGILLSTDFLSKRSWTPHFDFSTGTRVTFLQHVQHIFALIPFSFHVWRRLFSALFS